VELYELDPMPSARLAIGNMQGRPVLRVHAKAAIIDQRIVYLGSMNLDRARSHSKPRPESLSKADRSLPMCCESSTTRLRNRRGRYRSMEPAKCSGPRGIRRVLSRSSFGMKSKGCLLLRWISFR
jgi:hypothetical protein